MKIAFDVSALNTSYKTQGSGFYVKNLKEALLKHAPEHEYFFFESNKKLPSNVDVFHFTSFSPFAKTLPLLNFRNTVVTVHDLIPLVFKQHFPAGIKGKIAWNLNKMLLKSENSIITDSEASRRDITKILSLNPKKVYSIPLAAGEQFKTVSSKISHQVIKKYSLPESFALFVGDATWNKNLPNIARAISKTGIPIVLVGRVFSEKKDNNSWNRSYHEFMKIAQDKRKFIILGYLETNDLVNIYNSAQFLLMPSLYEGFGLPILEAMACGCPVITSKRGSLPEVAKNAAVYVDPEDVDDIANGIHRVMSEKGLMNKLKLLGKRNIENFSWKKTALDTIRVYLNTLR